ncbi:RPA49 polymerase, partial [Galbula dea]|nr:RPA49 polymerase [Galbula dea]
VRFANGRLQRSDSMRFTVYRNKDKAHPRKKFQRILVSETERLSYVGNNFGSGAMKCNSLCRYFVGVLDKDSGQMEVYNAEIFNMQPLLSACACIELLTAWLLTAVLSVVSLAAASVSLPAAWRKEDMLDSPSKALHDEKNRGRMFCVSPAQMDLCIEAFGTSKQKRALNVRRMNMVGDDVVSTAVAKAATNIIDAKGVTALIQDVAQDDVQNISTFLPPCNEDAEKPEDVYKFEDILSPAEYEALQVPAAVFVNITSEEITKKTEDKSHCSFVLEELKFLPADEKSRDHKARCLWFLDTLIKFSCLKVIKKK